MNILIIGFEKSNNIKYPHLKSVVDFFKAQHNADYLYFIERGYFLGSSSKIKENIGYLLSIAMSMFQLCHFLYKNIFNKYKKIIVIDNFTYILISIFSKKTILWSHDFVTNDQSHKNSLYQKIIAKGTNYFLNKRKKIIIQDINRLNLFCDSYCIDSDILDIFYMPVSSCPIVQKKTNEISSTPKLLQIGGINQYRSFSHDLVEQYQKDYIKYELYLHGFFDKHIKESILSKKNIPFCSSLELKADEVHKIVQKCDIGFLGYKSDNLNFYYISYASGQLVEFLKLGKPIIAFGNTDLKNLVLDYHIGVSIENLDELNSAVRYISSNYKELSHNCHKLFNDKYNLSIFLKNIYFWMFK